MCYDWVKHLNLIPLLGRCFAGILYAQTALGHFCLRAVDPTYYAWFCLFPGATTDKACVLDTDTVVRIKITWHLGN